MCWVSKTKFQGNRILLHLDWKLSSTLGSSHIHSEDGNSEKLDEVKGGFRAERDAQRKGDAGNRATWNTLFMRADTVVEAVAEHYGVKKSELMDRDASDLGVRMALGETQVIAKTKAALGEAGELSTPSIQIFKYAQDTSVLRVEKRMIFWNILYPLVFVIGSRCTKEFALFF